MKSNAWNVYTVFGELIDTVFFDADIDAWHVKHSLVNHDGYPEDIRVEKQFKRRE